MSTTSPNPAPAESIPRPPIDPELPAPLSMGEVMRIPMLRRLWYAQVVSVFGDFLALFAVISIITFRLHATAQRSQHLRSRISGPPVAISSTPSAPSPRPVSLHQQPWREQRLNRQHPAKKTPPPSARSGST